MTDQEIDKLEESIRTRVDKLLHATLHGIKDLHEDPKFLKKIGKPLSSNEALLCLMGVHASFVNFVREKVAKTKEIFDDQIVIDQIVIDQIVIDQALYNDFDKSKAEYLIELATLEKNLSRTTYVGYLAFNEFNLEKVVSCMNKKIHSIPSALAHEERLKIAYIAIADFFTQDFKNIDFKPNVLEKAYVCGTVLISLIDAYVNDIKKNAPNIELTGKHKSYIESVGAINQKIFYMHVFLSSCQIP